MLENTLKTEQFVVVGLVCRMFQRQKGWLLMSVRVVAPKQHDAACLIKWLISWKMVVTCNGCIFVANKFLLHPSRQQWHWTATCGAMVHGPIFYSTQVMEGRIACTTLITLHGMMNLTMCQYKIHYIYIYIYVYILLLKTTYKCDAHIHGSWHWPAMKLNRRRQSC